MVILVADVLRKGCGTSSWGMAHRRNQSICIATQDAQLLLRKLLTYFIQLSHRGLPFIRGGFFISGFFIDLNLHTLVEFIFFFAKLLPILVRILLVILWQIC